MFFAVTGTLLSKFDDDDDDDDDDDCCQLFTY